MTQQPATNRATVRTTSSRTAKAEPSRVPVPPSRVQTPSGFQYPVTLFDGSVFYAKSAGQKDILESATALVKAAEDRKKAEADRKKSFLYRIRRR